MNRCQEIRIPMLTDWSGKLRLKCVITFAVLKILHLNLGDFKWKVVSPISLHPV